jgi:hypothetical protein
MAADDVIEPPNLPERELIVLRVPVARTLPRGADELDQIGVALEPLDHEMDMIRHVAVRQNPKPLLKGDLAEYAIRLRHHARLPEPLATAKRAQRQKIGEETRVIEAFEPPDSIGIHTASARNRHAVDHDMQPPSLE